MIEKSFTSIIEDSYRNRFLFYYSGSSVCCKEILKDGSSKDMIIASQVSDKFLTAIDLLDNIYVVCINNEKGLYLYSYEKGQWKLDQILNIQGSGSIHLLSLFAHNGSIHIIYAKQMTIANFYNVIHLHKPSTPNSYHLNTAWRKNNVSEIYTEKLDSAYSAVITRDGAIHLVSEWYDGNNYVINCSWLDSNSDGWKNKQVTTLFKKDITVSILFDESSLHLLCYTYEDEISAIFYYTKKDGSNKDFEFSCLDKIKSEQAISPYFHIESGSIYMSWINNNKYLQYALNREQKNWVKKIDGTIPNHEILQNIEYIRNRKGKALIAKKTYFVVDYKNNISLPYFKDDITESSDFSEDKTFRNADGDLVRYIPYILDELKELSEIVKQLKERIEEGDVKLKTEPKLNGQTDTPKTEQAEKRQHSDTIKLKKSSFREQFMSTNKLLNRPEATALYVGPSSIPQPEELSSKEGMIFTENQASQEEDHSQDNQVITPAAESEPIKKDQEPINVNVQQKQESDAAIKDTNLFKKIGDFFK
ncbi:MAG TPA: hypothetical protein VEF53_19050 [Patescibacteria group bacterium]|nr:hypothetical protein [Patescibacteria group bacterium]